MDDVGTGQRDIAALGLRDFVVNVAVRFPVGLDSVGRQQPQRYWHVVTDAAFYLGVAVAVGERMGKECFPPNQRADAWAGLIVEQAIQRVLGGTSAGGAVALVGDERQAGGAFADDTHRCPDCGAGQRGGFIDTHAGFGGATTQQIQQRRIVDPGADDLAALLEAEQAL